MNTDSKIQAALLELMVEKDLKEITITDIAEKANLNRSTIYRHYANKYSILQKIEDDLFQYLGDFSNLEEGVNRTKVYLFLEKITLKKAHINILLSSNDDSEFNQAFSMYLTVKGLDLIDNLSDYTSWEKRQKELLIQYLSSALSGLINYWIMQPNISVKELEVFYVTMFKNGIESFGQLK